MKIIDNHKEVRYVHRQNVEVLIGGSPPGDWCFQALRKEFHDAVGTNLRSISPNQVGFMTLFITIHPNSSNGSGDGNGNANGTGSGTKPETVVALAGTSFSMLWGAIGFVAGKDPEINGILQIIDGVNTGVFTGLSSVLPGATPAPLNFLATAAGTATSFWAKDAFGNAFKALASSTSLNSTGWIAGATTTLGTAFLGWIGEEAIKLEYNYLSANEANIITYLSQRGTLRDDVADMQLAAQMATTEVTGYLSNALSAGLTTLEQKLGADSGNTSATSQDVANFATGLTSGLGSALTQALGDLGQGAINNSGLSAQITSQLQGDETSLNGLFSNSLSALTANTGALNNASTATNFLDSYLQSHDSALPSDVQDATDIAVTATNGQSTTLSDGLTIQAGSGEDYAISSNIDTNSNSDESLDITNDSVTAKFMDPATGKLTQENIVNSDGTSSITYDDPATNMPLLTDDFNSAGQVTKEVVAPNITAAQFASVTASALASQVIAQFLFKNNLPVFTLAQAFSNTALSDFFGTNNTAAIGAANLKAYGELTSYEQFVADYGVSLATLAANISGSILGTDLFKALGLPTQAESIVGGVISTQTIASIINIAANTNIDVAAGANSALSLASIETSLGTAGGTAIGNYLGADLSKLIIGDPTQGSSLGGAIGSAIGTYYGTSIGTAAGASTTVEAALAAELGTELGADIGSVLPVIGTIIGATLGSFLGSIIGSIFGPGKSVGPNALAAIQYNPATDSWSVVYANSDNGGNVNIAINMATAAEDELNAIVGSIGGKIINSTDIIGGGSWDLTHFNLGYYQERGYFSQNKLGEDKTNLFSNPTDAINNAVMRILRAALIQSGNPFMEYALAHSSATTVSGLITDLNAAHDYSLYVANPLLFDTSLALTNNQTNLNNWTAELQDVAALGMTNFPNTGNLNGTVLSVGASYIAANLEILNDFITSGEIASINVTASPTPTMTISEAQLRQYSSVFSIIGGQYNLLINWGAGGSQLDSFAEIPSNTNEEIENYSGLNATGTLNNISYNWAAGGSQESVLTGLSSGVKQELLNYSGANDTGTLDNLIYNWTWGGSQMQLFTGIPSDTYEEIENYSGANGSGTLESQVYNLTTGGSENIFFTGLASNVANEIKNYTGINATGTLEETYYNWKNGSSQEQIFVRIPSDTYEEVENFSGATASGTLKSQVYNLIAGGSENIFFTGLANGVANEIKNYTGANGTGTLEMTYYNWMAGGSQVQIVSGLPSGVSEETQNYAGPTGTVQLLNQIINWTGGGSQIQFFANLAPGYAESIVNYSGANATGTLNSIVYNWTAGGSQKDLRTALPSGLRQELLNYSGLNATGTITSRSYVGSSGNNTITADNFGNETLIGSGGSDKYIFGRGDGQGNIQNGLSSNTAASGQLDFASGITTGQIWLQKTGNNLKLDILGTQDQITIDGWFSNNYSQLQEIKTASGSMLDSHISQLVQAMAAYSTAHAGFNPVTAAQMPTDLALQSVLATAWHH